MMVDRIILTAGVYKLLNDSVANDSVENDPAKLLLKNGLPDKPY